MALTAQERADLEQARSLIDGVLATTDPPDPPPTGKRLEVVAKDLRLLPGPSSYPLQLKPDGSIGWWMNIGDTVELTVNATDVDAGAVLELRYRLTTDQQPATRHVYRGAITTPITFTPNASSWDADEWAIKQVPLSLQKGDQLIQVTSPTMDAGPLDLSSVAIRSTTEVKLVSPPNPPKPPDPTPDPNPVPNKTATPATLSSVLRGAQPGDVIGLESGDYGQLTLEGLNGAPGKHITLLGAPGTRVTRNNGWQYLMLHNLSFVTVHGIEVMGTGEQGNQANGIDIGAAHHVIVRRCYVHDVGGNGVGANHADCLWYDGNRIARAAWWSGYQCSGLSMYQCDNISVEKWLAGGRFTNAVTHNVVSDCANKQGAHTDGNGFIYDDQWHSQSDNAKYNGNCFAGGNLMVNNGGRGMHSPWSDALTAMLNTCALNQTDGALVASGEPGEHNTSFAKQAVHQFNLIYARQGRKWLQDGSNWGYDASNLVRDNIILGGNDGDVMGLGANTDLRSAGLGYFVNPNPEPTQGDWRPKAGARTAAVPGWVRDFLGTDLAGVPLPESPAVGAYQPA